MSKRSVTIIVLVISLGTVLIIASRWRVDVPVTFDDSRADVSDGLSQEESDENGLSRVETPSIDEPITGPTPRTVVADSPNTSTDQARQSQDLDDSPVSEGALNGLPALTEQIDSRLAGADVIARRGRSTNESFTLQSAEMQFSSEISDPAWAAEIEARIYDEVAQLSELRLTTLDVECRQTICRLKTFYAPGATAADSFGRFEPIANAVGFEDVVEVVTLDQGIATGSLLYIRRSADNRTQAVSPQSASL